MYIDHVKYYSNNSKWLAKLFLQFCHEYKFHLLMFETSESSLMSRRQRFNWLVNHPKFLSAAVTYFEPRENLLDPCIYGEKYCGPVFYRLFMWRYFLITHQDHIPRYFRLYIGVKQLVSELKKEGTRNDKRLKNIFKKIINN